MGIYRISEGDHMRIFTTIKILMVGSMMAVLFGCTGAQTMSSAARPGDTVMSLFRTSHNADRSNTSLIITDSFGTVTEYAAGDPRIKAVLRVYPDYISHFNVAQTRWEGIFPPPDDLPLRAYNEALKGNISTAAMPGDISQGMLVFDLPAQLEEGVANIQIITDEFSTSTSVEVLPGQGLTHTLDVTEAETSGSSGLQKLHHLERGEYDEIRLLPNDAGLLADNMVSADITLTHDPDTSLGGTGAPFVTTPGHSGINVNWYGDGTTLRLLVTPSSDRIAKPALYASIYIAGGLQNLSVQSSTAYDRDGEVMPFMVAALSPRITSISSPGGISAGSTVTVQGRGLCLCGGSLPTQVKVKNGNSWVSVTPYNNTENSFDIVLPPDMASGPARLSVRVGGANGGRTSSQFDVL